MPAIIENLNNRLIELLGPLGPLIALGLLGLLLIAAALPVMLKRVQDPMDRLREQTKTTYQPAAKAAGKDGKAKKLRTKDGTDKLDRFATFLEPQDVDEYSAARLKLLQAGYRAKNSVRVYHFAQFALGILFLIGGIIYALLQGGDEMGMQKMAMSVLIPGAAGYYLPVYWVERRRMARQEEITNGFPDALDLMLVCVEAGQSLDQSIIRVSQEIRAGYPALADEFEIVAQEVKAGKDKSTVLRDMAERSGVADISSFTTVLIQSASFGTSVADALRVFASEMRDKRVMRAEEKANKLPTKLTLGTMLFTLPPLLIILIGPSIYDIGQTLGSMNVR
ncbi:pilus assembly protein TadC [Maritimibacter sp. 55A14]|uniref:type II secretion system F family protein n=1 Tax=Maritimibacter sp. 55A14 TaxID=2174844 RepID=UPI000D609940|nr:type II secretion system F family protein [Maritimibacter sp. 55A14]PWE31981.1 pilus assembly protein TadC [Maritimibacter sp. 55A14]